MKQPSFWSVWRHQGLRAAVNYKAERMCVSALAKACRDSRKYGMKGIRPEYRMPWWFCIVSKIEFKTRRKSK